jgi:rare lipoprotein A
MSRFQGISIFLLLTVLLGAAAIHARQSSDDKQTGLASWYGDDAGAMTASGEKYDPTLLTAAHRELPFGTVIRVTNQRNGRSVEVRINDRGPFTGGRILDVSSAAADKLDMKDAGVVTVELEVVLPAKGKKAP